MMNILKKLLLPSFLLLAMLGFVLSSTQVLAQPINNGIQDPVELGQFETPNGGQAPTGFVGPEDLGCDAGSLSWIVCDLIDASVNVVNFIRDEVIEPFLYTPPVISESQTAVFEVWQVVRNIAFALLVPIFLLMIIMQALGGGAVQAYTVKKILPRVFVAAIGISLSIYIAALLIDFFNVLGLSIDQIITSIGEANGIDIGGGTVAALAGLSVLGIILGGSAASILVAGLVGVNGGLAVGFIALFIILPVLLALIILFGTLIFRQVLIIVLVIASPLGMLAWVLPSTEGYAKKWFEWFVKALLMYPLVIILLSSGGLFASILSDSQSADGEVNFLADVSAVFAIIIPIALVAKTADFAGDTMRAVVNGLRNAASKTRERARGDVENPYSTQNRFRRQQHDNADRRLFNKGGLVGVNNRVFNNENTTAGKFEKGLRRSINMVVGGRMPQATKRAVEDMEYGAQIVENLLGTGYEDAVYAAAFTGGGAFNGVQVRVAGANGQNATAWSARLKKDLELVKPVYDASGNHQLDANGNLEYQAVGLNDQADVFGNQFGGQAIIRDGKVDGGVRAATESDFYDDRTVELGQNLSKQSPGFMVDATRYTIRDSHKTYDHDRLQHAYGTTSPNSWFETENSQLTRRDRWVRAWITSQDKKGYYRFYDFGGYTDGGVRSTEFAKDQMGSRALPWNLYDALDYQRKHWSTYELSQMDGDHLQKYADELTQIYDSNTRGGDNAAALDLIDLVGQSQNSARAGILGMTAGLIRSVMRGEQEFTPAQKDFIYSEEKVNGEIIESGLLTQMQVDDISLGRMLKLTREKAAEVAGSTDTGRGYFLHKGYDAAGNKTYESVANTSSASGNTETSADNLRKGISRLIGTTVKRNDNS